MLYKNNKKDKTGTCTPGLSRIWTGDTFRVWGLAKHVVEIYVGHLVLPIVCGVDTVGVLDVVSIDVLPLGGVPVLVPPQLAVTKQGVAYKQSRG